uniref:Reverse transcriptase domain-containing protein n=1 Tax=Tanacetum cinerariifolium TaxID=118510 RepID=A0A6L2MST4_TANCI|nr:reverse transcriptase domain-containing protein [Tanacetum cinerariifolium]
MRTRSSSNLPGESSPNPTSSNPKRRNRRHSKQPFILEESPVDTMADHRTMAELLRGPTEGYAKEIMVLPILAEQFKLKHSLINMMTLDQFFRLEKDNPHDHIRWFNKITSTIKYKDVPNSAIKLMLFPFSLAGAARRWLEKEPTHLFSLGRILFPNSLMNSFPPQERQISIMKFLTFNNGLMNRFMRHRIDTKISFVHALVMCLAADGNTFPKLRDNIQGYVSVATVNYNQGNSSYRPLGSGPLPSNTIANPNGKLKAITTRIGIVLDGPSIPIPPPFINPEEDERVEETLTGQDLAEYTIKVPPPLVQKPKPPSQRNFMAGFARYVFVPVGKFTFPADFVIVDYKSDPRVPLILGRPFLRTTCALIDVHREEMILRNGDERLTLNMRHDTSSYSNQPQKESINMINIFNDLKVKDDIFNPEEGNVLIRKLLDLDPTKYLPPPHNINPLSGSTTSSSPNHLLEVFADELALITFPPGNNDLSFDIESDLKEIEYLLNHNPIKDMDSILKDSIDEDNLADLNDNLVDTMPDMFTDEHALDYSSPLLYDEYDDDLFEVESDTEYVYDDPFDSKEDEIKESKLLIDELDPLRSSDFLPSHKYDSFLFEVFSEVDPLPSTNNEDKVFNLYTLIHENLFEVITRVAPDKNVKKMAISHAFLILEDFDPPLYELPFLKEVPGTQTLLLFSSENEETVFKPGILTSKGIHSSLLPELSHRGPKSFKIIKILESPMEIFPCSFGEDIRILDVSYLHFYPS